jgi:hypothetical protein
MPRGHLLEAIPRGKGDVSDFGPRYSSTQFVVALSLGHKLAPMVVINHRVLFQVLPGFLLRRFLFSRGQIIGGQRRAVDIDGALKGMEPNLSLMTASNYGTPHRENDNRQQLAK